MKQGRYYTTDMYNNIKKRINELILVKDTLTHDEITELCKDNEIKNQLKVHTTPRKELKLEIHFVESDFEVKLTVKNLKYIPYKYIKIIKSEKNAIIRTELKYYINEAFRKLNLDDINMVKLNMIPKRELRLNMLLINTFINMAD